MRFNTKFLSVLTLCVAGTALSPVAANAAGFYIQEQSVSGLGSAFSGSTTNLNDPSTIYFNPAGMTKLEGTQAQAGVHVLIPNAELTDTGSTVLAAPVGGGDGGNPYDPTPVPNAYISHQVNNNVWLGLGITAPFGLANEYDDGWFGRYDSTKTELLTLDIQPTVAYKVNNQLSIGGGINVQYADAQLDSVVTNGVTEGESSLKGDDWSFGYNLGVQYEPIEGTRLGASYRSAISHKLEGDIEITGVVGLNRDDSASADLDLPDVATFGIAQDLNDKWTLMAQATWFGWNNFQDIDAEPDSGTDPAAIVQNYQTTWAFAVGAEYAHNEKWTFRGGVQIDETPTTDQYRTTRTPDGDRTWGSLGATYKINERMSLDLAATYIHIEDETINVSRNGGLATVSADTEGDVGILAAGFTYKF